MRFTSICLYTLVAAVALVIALSPLRHPPAAHSTEAQGDRWRLPWTAGVEHIVGGNGYGQDTHTGTEAYALDFNIPEGDYEVASQEGYIKKAVADTSCVGYGTYVQVEDVGGFVHTYAHMRENLWNGREGAHVQPGWVLGKSGHTGYTGNCNQPHLHYKISGGTCANGLCIPEPLSDNCADWQSAYQINITCTLMGPDNAFSHDPSWGIVNVPATPPPADPWDPWKANSHLSNNAGVGDYVVRNGQPLPAPDTVIQARFDDEGAARYMWLHSVRVVGKPQNWVFPGPVGALGEPWAADAGFYVHRVNGWHGNGVLQYFDSPDAAFGQGAIMHGDNVTHDSSDGRANINAMWVYGEFWQNLISQCRGQDLGRPPASRIEKK